MRRIVLLPPVDPDPTETARREVELVPTWRDGVVGVAGWSDHGWEALQLGAEHPEVERLVLLAAIGLFVVRWWRIRSRGQRRAGRRQGGSGDVPERSRP